MFRLIAALFLATASPLAAGAQPCGFERPSCGIDGGEYHAETPDGAGPHPAVMFLHGYGGTSAGTMRNRGLVRALLARGYAVVAPQGLPFREGQRGGSWNSMERAGRRDDVAFLEAVADDAAARHGIDRNRMLMAGFSGGGMMTWRVACDAPESFAAYAPIAGLMWRPQPTECAGPFAMQHTHGWADEVVPLEGRSVASGRFTQGNLFVGLDLARDALRCARDDPDEYGATDGYLIRRWTACAEGAALEMALHPGGHTIPRGWSALALDWFEGLGAAAREKAALEAGTSN